MEKLSKLIFLLSLLFSSVFAEEIKITNFSIGYNTTDGSCYPMNDVDAFYVFKLYKKGDIKINLEHHMNTGVIIKATEVYGNHTIDYIFYNNMTTCKIYKNK